MRIGTLPTWVWLTTAWLSACSYGVNVLDLREQATGVPSQPDAGNGDPSPLDPGADPQIPAGCVVRVDGRAVGPLFDGLSWASAFPDLPAALLLAFSRAPCEVWVAGGTYLAYRVGPANSFELQDGLSVYGGFSGQESSRPQRQPGKYPSILEGQGRVYHVARAQGNARLDGFTLQGGLAHCSSASAVANPCLAEDFMGGGLLVTGGSVTVSSCTFLRNEASMGGGIFQTGGTLTLHNSRFVENFAESSGGAIHTEQGEAKLVSCAFFENFSNGYGDTIYNQAGAYVIQNSTFVDTQSAVGELYYQENVKPLRIQNSIFWASDTRVYPLSLPAQYVDISYSTFSMNQGAASGPGNLLANPGFVDLPNGDLRLRDGSSCIDAADGTGAPDRDLAGRPRVDHPGIANTGSGAIPYVDMGAFEYQP